MGIIIFFTVLYSNQLISVYVTNIYNVTFRGTNLVGLKIIE